MLQLKRRTWTGGCKPLTPYASKECNRRWTTRQPCREKLCPTIPETLIIVGVPPNRVDILTHLEGLDFQSAWERRCQGSFRQQPVPFLGLDDWIHSKRQAGRPQDLADLRRLERLRARMTE